MFQTEQQFAGGAALAHATDGGMLEKFFEHEMFEEHKSFQWLNVGAPSRLYQRGNPAGTVSRYYPRLKIAVDFVRMDGTIKHEDAAADVRARRQEIERKKKLCVEHGIAYVGITEHDILDADMIAAAKAAVAGFVDQPVAAHRGPNPGVRVVDRTKDGFLPR